MIRSKHADRFNHDDSAPNYDAGVLKEEHPIRDGYSATIDWVVERARVIPTDTVVDIGIGTGNLATRLPTCSSLTGIDVSTEMTSIARQKLGNTVEIINQDALTWAHTDTSFDVLVSTFALHHLTENEKHLFLERSAARLTSAGRIVIGDLGFADADERKSMIANWRQHDPFNMIDAEQDEFFWDVAVAKELLHELGLEVETQQFGPLIWGIFAWRPSSDN